MDIFGGDIPFAGHCGIEPIGFADGRTRLRARARPEHVNNLGIAHGGLICTLLDVAMGTAARCTVGLRVMTLDMQASFLSPGRGELTAEGRLVAKASGLFKPVTPQEPSRAVLPGPSS